MIVIALTIGETYGDFNRCGFFIGTRDQFALTFPFVNEYDDFQIAELAERFGAKAKYYSIEDGTEDAFIRDYGAMPEPVINETYLRQTIHHNKNGGFVAPYCKLNTILNSYNFHCAIV